MRLDTVADQRAARTIWIDARAGVAGDMLLAALLDAGASLEVVRRDVAAVIGGAVAISATEVMRGVMRATAVTVDLLEPDQPHRPWVEVRRLITEADVPERVRHHALLVFTALAEAEARVHGTEVDDVHFHEVGAWDSIADVVGVCSALEDLAIGMLFTSEISVGNGYVRTAHGSMPVPVPAVLELLSTSVEFARSIPVAHGVGHDEPAPDVGELATPTGVAVLVALSDGGGPGGLMPSRVGGSGIGAGTRDDLPWPNIVRVVLSPDSRHSEPLWADGLTHRYLEELSANVDDLDPRLWPSVLDALLAAGARDAWLTPIHMKKGRPAFTVTALVEGDASAAVQHAIFTTTSTFGVRSNHTSRVELDRTWVPVEVTLASHTADISIKVGANAGEIVRATPEYEQVARFAQEAARPVAEVLTAAIAEAHQAGLRPGERLPHDT